MKDALQQFEQLAARARADAPPRIDVCPQVLHRLAVLQAYSDERPLLWLTAGSVATAALLGGLSFSFFSLLSDPTGILFHVTPLLSQ